MIETLVLECSHPGAASTSPAPAASSLTCSVKLNGTTGFDPAGAFLYQWPPRGKMIAGTIGLGYTTADNGALVIYYVNEVPDNGECEMGADGQGMMFNDGRRGLLPNGDVLLPDSGARRLQSFHRARARSKKR